MGARMVRVIELSRPPLADGIHICDAQFQGQRVKVRVHPADLAANLVVLGATGTGKSLLQEHLFRECARAGLGGIYVDPYGYSVWHLLATLPDEILSDVVIIEVRRPDLMVTDYPSAVEQSIQDFRQILTGGGRRLVLMNLNVQSVGAQVATAAALIVEETIRRMREDGELTGFVQLVDDPPKTVDAYSNPQLPTLLSEQTSDDLPEWAGGAAVIALRPLHYDAGPDYVRLLGAQGALADADMLDLPPLTGYATLQVDGAMTGPITCWLPPPADVLRHPESAAVTVQRWTPAASTFKG